MMSNAELIDEYLKIRRVVERPSSDRIASYIYEQIRTKNPLYDDITVEQISALIGTDDWLKVEKKRYFKYLRDIMRASLSYKKYNSTNQYIVKSASDDLNIFFNQVAYTKQDVKQEITSSQTEPLKIEVISSDNENNNSESVS